MVFTGDEALRHVRAQDGGQRELWFAVGKQRRGDDIAPAVQQLRAIDADAGIGQLVFAIGAHAAVGVEGEIAVGRLGRPIHHYQMGQTGWFARQLGEIEVGPDIAVDQQKGGVAQQRQRVPHAAAGFQRCIAFMDVADAQAPLCAVAQCRGELVCQPRGVDDHIADAQRSQFLQMPRDQRLAGHRQKRLGGVVGQRAHALAEASGENQRLHALTLAKAGLRVCSSRTCRGSSARYFGTTASR
jgi:hypothetical protein